MTGALSTGYRYGELAAMTVDDFNADGGTLRVRISKSGKPRHVLLTDEGHRLLSRLAPGKPDSARLFVRDKGKPWGKSEQQRPLAAACAVAKIDPPAHFHALRHSCASRLAMKGVPLAVIAAPLGHSAHPHDRETYRHMSAGYVADTVRARDTWSLRAVQRGANHGDALNSSMRRIG